MKPLFRLFAILLLSLPLLAAGKAFKGTSDYRDPKELNGFLNVKLDTYASMVKEPKGTDCDWVMVDPSFDLADLQKTTVEFSPDSITRNGGWDASYWGFYGGMRGLRRSVHVAGKVAREDHLSNSVMAIIGFAGAAGQVFFGIDPVPGHLSGSLIALIGLVSVLAPVAGGFCATWGAIEGARSQAGL